MVTHTEILIFHFLLLYILSSPSFKKINVWVMLLSIFKHSVGAVFPTLRPISYCEWVFHLAILWVYSLQGIHMKLAALPNSFNVSVNVNWAFICGYAYVNFCTFCNANAYNIKKTTPKPNNKPPLNSHMYLFFFFWLYWFFFQLLSVYEYHFAVIILSLALTWILWCLLPPGICWKVPYLMKKYVLFMSWSLQS